MNELNSFVVANAARIPCTVRTLKPYWSAGDSNPWCHQGELADALLYLAVRSGLPDSEVRALKETFENLSSSLKNSSENPDRPQGNDTHTNEPLTPTTPASKID